MILSQSVELILSSVNSQLNVTLIHWMNFVLLEYYSAHGVKATNI